MAKLHVRHLVGGRAPQARDERLYRFEFPERPGALLTFLSKMRSDWNISLFHYRNHGADYGRVLAGIQVPRRDDAKFRRFLSDLGYRHWDESANPAYRLFLGCLSRAERTRGDPPQRVTVALWETRRLLRPRRAQKTSGTRRRRAASPPSGPSPGRSAARPSRPWSRMILNSAERTNWPSLTRDAAAAPAVWSAIVGLDTGVNVSRPAGGGAVSRGSTGRARARAGRTPGGCRGPR